MTGTTPEKNVRKILDTTATKAAEDVIQVSQLEKLATKTDIANLEARLIKWMVGSLAVFATIIVTLG